MTISCNIPLKTSTDGKCRLPDLSADSSAADSYSVAACSGRTSDWNETSFGKGTLYLTDSGMYWVRSEEDKKSDETQSDGGIESLSFALADIAIHAIAKENGLPTLYLQIEGDASCLPLKQQPPPPPPAAEDLSEDGAGADEETREGSSSSSEDEEESESPVVEILFSFESMTDVENSFEKLSEKLKEISKSEAKKDESSESESDEDEDEEEDGKQTPLRDTLDEAVTESSVHE